MVTNILVTALGAFFMVMAFVATGITGAFGGGTTHPIRLAGRVILFAAGLLAFFTGLSRLLK
jgi:hypothetical protein